MPTKKSVKKSALATRKTSGSTKAKRPKVTAAEKSKSKPKTMSKSSEALQAAVAKPLSKKNGWFYVSISMAAFFVTLTVGTFINPQVGKYLQANLLADIPEQTVSPQKEETAPLSLTIITQNHNNWNPVTAEATKKLESIFTSVFAGNVRMETKELSNAFDLVQKYGIETLPAVVASPGLKNTDMYNTMKEFFSPVDGGYLLMAEKMNPKDQVYLHPKVYNGLELGSGSSPVSLVEITDFSASSLRFYNENWGQIEKQLLSQVNYTLVFRPDPEQPLEMDAAVLATCYQQQNPGDKEGLLNYIRTLYRAPQLTKSIVNKSGIKPESCDVPGITGTFLYSWPTEEPHALIINGPKYSRLVSGDVTYSELEQFVKEQEE